MASSTMQLAALCEKNSPLESNPQYLNTRENQNLIYILLVIKYPCLISLGTVTWREIPDY